jgi:hypothetical protein
LNWASASVRFFEWLAMVAPIDRTDRLLPYRRHHSPAGALSYTWAARLLCIVNDGQLTRQTGPRAAFEEAGLAFGVSDIAENHTSLTA